MWLLLVNEYGIVFKDVLFFIESCNFYVCKMFKKFKVLESEVRE